MRATSRIVVLAALVAAFAWQSVAQTQHRNQERGFNATGAFSSFDVDSINLFNGNLVITIPVGNTYRVGGQLSYSLKLVYNSNSWTQREVCSNVVGNSRSPSGYSTYGTLVNVTPNGPGLMWATETVPNDNYSVAQTDYPYVNNVRGADQDCHIMNEPNPAANAGLGWHLSLGKLYAPPTHAQTPVDRFYIFSTTEKSRWVYMAPDGSEHTFYQRLHESDPDNHSDVWYTRDNSYLRMRTNLDGQTNPGEIKIEFPNGEMHYFKRILIRESDPTLQLMEDVYEYKISRIEDRFGNWVDIGYADDGDAAGTDSDDYRDNRWDITDSAGRSHVVRFGKITDEFPKVISSVALTTFGTDKAFYTFSYDARTIERAGPHTAATIYPAYTSELSVPFLKSVSLPDGSQFAMPVDSSYYLTGLPKNTGVIKGLTLPTGARVEWEYLPDASVQPTNPDYRGWVFPMNSAARHYLRWGVGIRKRTLKREGEQERVWKYDPRLVFPEGCTYSSFDEDCAGLYSVTKVTTPEGDYTNHYFSVFPFPYDGTVRNSLTEPHRADYGLPFVKQAPPGKLSVAPVIQSDHAGKPLFLSTEVFDKNNNPFRRTYVRYDFDQVVADDGFGMLIDANARVAAVRTVFLDDGSRYAEEQHSDFDGVGNYRTKQTYGNVGGDRRVEFTNYNPLTKTYAINPLTNTTAAGHDYVPFPESRAWVLGTYDRQSAGDFSKRSTTFFEYNAVGQLLKKRVMKELEPHAAGDADLEESSYRLLGSDVLVTYVYSAEGNLTSETAYGGDKKDNLSTSDRFAVPAASGYDYKINYGYPLCNNRQLGVVATKQYQAANFLSEDYDIDCNTGLVTASRDTSKNKTTYGYGAMWRLLDIRREQGHYTKITYYPVRNGATAGTPRITVEHKDRATNNNFTDEEYKYDQLGRLTNEFVRLPNGTRAGRFTGYNAMGWTLSVSEWIESDQAPDGRKTTFSNFDPAGRPAQSTLPDGRVVKHQQSGVRQIYRRASIGTSIDAQGAVSLSDAERYERYDRHGRLVEVEEPSGVGGAMVKTNYGYNVAHKLVWSSTSASVPGAATPVGQGRSFDYDNLGNLRAESHPERPWASYGGYDTMGNVGTAFDGAHTLRYAYDAAGRPTKVEESTPAGFRPLKEFSYHNSNTTAVGGLYALGKLDTAKRHNWVTNPYSAAAATEIDVVVSEQYGYGGTDGRLNKKTTAVYSGASPIADFEQSLAYDQLGNLSRQDYPNCKNATCINSGGASRAWRVNYTYGRGTLTAVGGGAGTSAATTNYASSISYHPNRTINAVAHGNGVSDVNGLDADYMPRASSISAQKGATRLWDSGSYKYDGAGNVTRAGGDWYLYDKVNRLVEGTAMSAPGLKQKYSYDAFGNILTVETLSSATYTGGVRVGNVYTPGVNSSTNRLGLSYDGAGNTLGFVGQKPLYTYDALNMIKKAQDSTYVYGPGDERVWTIINPPGNTLERNVTERYTLRGLNNEVLRQYVVYGGNYAGNWRWEKDYVYAGGRLLAAETPLGVRHYHPDHLGTPRLVTDASGTVLPGSRQFQTLPFGEDASTYLGTASALPPEERLRFTGHERDTDFAGQTLDYMHARFYKAGLGKFLSIDPGRDWDAAQPQSWNLYGYVRGNPVNRTDPTGRNMLNRLYPNSCVQGGQYPTLFELWAEKAKAEQRVERASRLQDDAIESGHLESLIMQNAPAIRGLTAARAVAATAAAKKAATETAEAAGERIITVIGVTDDTAKYLGRRGYNVLKVPEEAWSHGYNGQWLGQALSRGDDILLATDPVKLQKALSVAGKESIYLRFELPAVQNWFGTLSHPKVLIGY